MKRIWNMLLCVLLILSLVCTFPPVYALQTSYTNSKDLHKAHENNSRGVPIYNGQVVTVEGVVTVATGVWHDNANYFTIVTQKNSYRFAGGIAVYLPGKAARYHIGDKVIVTGMLSNTGYASDSGTTVICPASANDIILVGSGFELPDPFPIFSDPQYSEVELDKGYRFEGMPVRVMGVVHGYDNEGTVRGFYVDGSRDGNYSDGQGAIYIKIYDYSGISLDQVKDGDWVVVEGILFQNDTSSPYTSGYYLRPTQQSDIEIISSSTVILLSEAMRKDTTGIPVLLGKRILVEGIATVNSGTWNSASNAFSVVTERPTPGLDPVYPEGAMYVYGAGAVTPNVLRGDKVRIAGTVGVSGYDSGMPALLQPTITHLSSGNDVMTEKLIRSDYQYAELSSIEGMPVKLQGRVFDIDTTGITQGFSIDASSDHNWTDKIGMIRVKTYNYSGIGLDGLVEGELVTIRGVLQKNVAEAPYTNGYFVRLRNQEDIVKRADHPRRTLYIQLDAFRNDYIGRDGWDTANFEMLINGGTRCMDSYGEYVSMTTANMTTLMTGAHTSTHNVPALAFYDAATDRRVRNLQNYDVDTIGEVYQNAGLITAAVKQRKLQNRGADFMLDGGTIAQTRDDAIDLIMNEDPDLLVVLFNETDSTAHAYGTDSEQIKAVVEEIDDAIGSIISALRAKGVLENTNIVIGADHSTDNVQHNITSQLVAALENTGIPFENAALDMGPFHRNTKVVYNLSSAAAQIYIRMPLSAEEETRLVAALEGIQGVASVYNRAQLDAMNTPANLGDYVVDCALGYAFSTSVAEHGSRAQQHTFMVYYGPGIKEQFQYTTQCGNVDIVPTILHLNNLEIPTTVDGEVLNGILTETP